MSRSLANKYKLWHGQDYAAFNPVVNLPHCYFLNIPSSTNIFMIGPIPVFLHYMSKITRKIPLKILTSSWNPSHFYKTVYYKLLIVNQNCYSSYLVRKSRVLIPCIYKKKSRTGKFIISHLSTERVELHYFHTA